ncbi:MAG: AMP-binding protein, partial [Oceanobacter sp.]
MTVNADVHPINLINHPIEVIHREDGTQLVRPIEPLAEFPTSMVDRLEKWATETPDTVMIAQRHPDGHWLEVTYGDAYKQVKSIAQWMLDLRVDGEPLSQERPLAVLSGNSTEHLLLALAAMYIGVPYAPISEPYSTVSTDYGKLRHIFENLTPGLVFAGNLGPFVDAINAVSPESVPVVSVESAHAKEDLKSPLTDWATLIGTEVTDAIDAARAKVTGDTIAKFLFTSGSTGMPKGVINTQQMICSNQQILLQTFAFLAERPPVLLEWLPWNHTFGGNQNVGIVIYNGGSLYLDEGKPTPKLLHKTVENLADVSPTIYFNVPKGFELLVHELKKNEEVAAKFF